MESYDITLVVLLDYTFADINQPSVRISTTAKYNQGLFILDVAKAPYGCGM